MRGLVNNEKGKITKSDQSHNSYKEYKNKGRAKIYPGHIRGGFSCLGETSNPRLPVTPVFSPIFLLGKHDNPSKNQT